MLKKIFLVSAALAGIFAVAYTAVAASNSNLVNVTSCTQVGSDIKITRSGKTYNLTSTCRDAGYGYRNYKMTCTSKTQYKVEWTENCVPPTPRDTTSPTVTVSTNQSTYDLYSTINVSVSATDNVKVTKIELYRDGTKLKEVSGSSLSYDFYAGWSGTINFKARAYDAQGNVGYDDVSVRVRDNYYDSSSPTVDLVSNRSSYESGNTVYLTARASDNNRVKKIVVYNGDDNVLRTCEYTTICETNETLSSSYRGTRRYYARVYDENGNSGYDSLNVEVYRDYDYDDGISISAPINLFDDNGVSWVKINVSAHADRDISAIEIYLGTNSRKYNQPLVKKCMFSGNNENEGCVLTFPRSMFSNGYYYARVVAENNGSKDTDLNYFSY